MLLQLAEMCVIATPGVLASFARQALDGGKMFKETRYLVRRSLGDDGNVNLKCLRMLGN